jgi:hypothetical protein
MVAHLHFFRPTNPSKKNAKELPAYARPKLQKILSQWDTAAGNARACCTTLQK